MKKLSDSDTKHTYSMTEDLYMMDHTRGPIIKLFSYIYINAHRKFRGCANFSDVKKYGRRCGLSVFIDECCSTLPISSIARYEINTGLYDEYYSD